MTQAAFLSQLSEDIATIRSWSQAAPGIALAEIDTINVLIGDGTNVITTGIVAALRVDFNAFITGGYLMEFDGTTGSISISIAKATYSVGVSPAFGNIVGSAPLVITSSRYSENTLLTGWTRDIARGSVLRFSVDSITSFKRVLVALRIRRLEP